MKRTNATPACVPRVKLLPACLALALVVGSNVLSPASADAASRPVAPAVSIEGSFGAVNRVALSQYQRQALVSFMQSKARPLPAIPATSIAVTNCNDSGPGSFRQAVNDAVSGDTIDLTNTGCSTITLTTGDVITAANDLTLQGPGAFGLTISGGYLYRPLEHLGTGTVTINDVSIADGKKYLPDGGFGNASGGCVASGSGTVAINNSWIKYCDAGSSSTSTAVRGGAVFGYAGVSVINSIVSGSTAHSSAFGAYGGGVYTTGYLTVAYSQIFGNTVNSPTRPTGGGAQVGAFFGVPGGNAFFKYSTVSDNAGNIGGGLYLTGDIFMTNSTVSANAGGNTGGIVMFNLGNATGPWKLNNSTVSGNTAIFNAGGVQVSGNDGEFQNSTIAFNTTYGANKYGGGVSIKSANNVDLQSVLISNNTTDLGDGNGPQVDDIGGISGATTSGANNLVYFPSSVVTPGGTILLTDPLLAPLADNGGSTYTHGLYPTSVAIDVGNNVLGAASDQRGSGFPRVVGAGPDIGAFEGTVSDTIFADGFD